MAQSMVMDTATPTPTDDAVEASGLWSTPAAPVVGSASASVTLTPAPAIDPVYAPVEPTVPPVGPAYDANRSGYETAQPQTVSEQITSLGQSQLSPTPAITPVVPLAHMTEEPVLMPSPDLPVVPVAPVQVDSPLAQPVTTSSMASPIVPEAVVPEQIEVRPTTLPLADKKAPLPTTAVSSKISLILLIVVFIVMFGLVAVLGYWIGLQQR